MSTAELAEARRPIARLSLPVRPIRSRRSFADPSGPRPDWRGTIRRSLGQAGELSSFATRLTNITRHLHRRDLDEALAAAGAEARDWQGGTRIGASLHGFDRDWSRRVMGHGAVVLLITDGLDRDAETGPTREIQRLHLSRRRLIWRKPLLRWDGFLPRARGIRAMLPHVDCFRSGHSITALEGLTQAISSASDGGERDRLLRFLGPQDGAARWTFANGAKPAALR